MQKKVLCLFITTPSRNRKYILAAYFINLLKFLNLLKPLKNLNINPNMNPQNFHPQNPPLRQKKLQIPQKGTTFAAFFNLNLYSKMKTAEQESTVVADALAPRSIEDIKKSYPDEWILLGNPEEYDQDIISGVLLYHSPDKREVCYLGRPLVKEYDKVALFFNRVTPRRHNRPVIASIFSSYKSVNNEIQV